MRRIAIACTLIVILLSISPAMAGQKKFKVLFVVVPTYTYYNSEINSFIKRELRDIKDVDIVNKEGNSDYFISVIAAPLKINNRISGVALSYVLEHGQDIIHNIFIGNSDQIQQMCKRIVAEFDTNFLEPNRK